MHSRMPQNPARGKKFRVKNSNKGSSGESGRRRASGERLQVSGQQETKCFRVSKTKGLRYQVSGKTKPQFFMRRRFRPRNQAFVISVAGLRGYSCAPAGLNLSRPFHPQLTLWAVFFRRYAASLRRRGYACASPMPSSRRDREVGWPTQRRSARACGCRL